MIARIYVASSWRNILQPLIANELQHRGHEVYDFKNPPDRQGGFKWSDIDTNWKDWTLEKYRECLLNDPMASHGFTADIRGLYWCDTCLLVLPSGHSAHIELGMAIGMGKRGIILLSKDQFEPELMYLLAQHVCINMNEVVQCLKQC